MTNLFQRSMTRDGYGIAYQPLFIPASGSQKNVSERVPQHFKAFVEISSKKYGNIYPQQLRL